ncbi:MAG: hypothetical protein OCC49_10360 [Fibrobacterales bacterium]
MIKKILILGALVMSSLQAGTKTKVGYGKLYLSVVNKQIKYVLDLKDADSQKTMKANHEFALKSGNECNIFIKWMNPLKYQIKWQDKAFENKNSKVIKEFMNKLSLPGVPKLNTEFVATTKNSESISQDPSINEKHLNYTNTNLVMLQILNGLHDAKTKTDKDNKSKQINNLVKEVQRIDSLTSIDYHNIVNQFTKKLFNITNRELVRGSIDTIKKSLNRYTHQFDTAYILLAQLGHKLPQKDTTDENNSLNVLVSSSFVNFKYSVLQKISDFKGLTKGLSSIIDIMEKSLVPKSEENAPNDFVFVRALDFESNENLDVSLTITLFEYNEKDIAFKERETIAQNTMIFSPYDFFNFKVASGAFYSNTTITKYGYKQNGTGQYIITDENIERGQPSVAMFMNMGVDLLYSQYVVPCLQIGIDPIQTHPFLLTGFGVTFEQIGVTVSWGGTWIFEPKLKSLNVGDVITETTQLDKDLQYDYMSTPKGWYFAVVYNIL